MKDNEIIKAVEVFAEGLACNECPFYNFSADHKVKCINCEAVPHEFWEGLHGIINRQKAEIEKYEQLIPNKYCICTRVGNGLIYSESTEDYDNIIAEISTEAIKEFAERLCEGRVSNDPVVIAVKAELKMTEGNGNA